MKRFFTRERVLESMADAVWCAVPIAALMTFAWHVSAIELAAFVVGILVFTTVFRTFTRPWRGGPGSRLGVS